MQKPTQAEFEMAESLNGVWVLNMTDEQVATLHRVHAWRVEQRWSQLSKLEREANAYNASQYGKGKYNGD